MRSGGKRRTRGSGAARRGFRRWHEARPDRQAIQREEAGEGPQVCREDASHRPGREGSWSGRQHGGGGEERSS